MNFNGSFGDWLKQRRKALDLTQRELADQVACAIVTIQKIERNTGRPSKQITERLANVLAISQEERTAFVAFARHTIGVAPSAPVPTTVETASHNLPSQSTRFVGRANELVQIAERLADPDCRLLTLVGPGGIGKTRLALRAAADRISDFAHGVHWISLGSVGSPDMIASSIADALKISFYGKEDPVVQLVRYLRERQALLVVDNFEHLLAGVGLLTDILAGGSRVKILVTSRERLNVREEWAVPIGGLDFPDNGGKIEIALAESYSAVQLFAQNALRMLPGFSLVSDFEAVIDICQAVEGMPLGIELAATWLRVMPCRQIAGQIRRDLDFLATPLRNVPERHRNIRAVFDHSWNLLSEPERSAMMNLSVFRGGFDNDAAREVAGASLSLLLGLVDKSFIRLNTVGRYDFHELVRQYAADHLADCGQANSTAQKHLDYFVAKGEKDDFELGGPPRTAWYSYVETELDNVRTALQWSISGGQVEAGLRLAVAASHFWGSNTNRIEGRDWLERLLTEANNAPLSLRAKAMCYLGALIADLLEPERGELLLKTSLALSRQSEDRLATATTLRLLGHVILSQNDLLRAVPPLEEAVTLFRKLGTPYGLAYSLLFLGRVMRRMGDFERAAALFDEALVQARETHMKDTIGWAFQGLGDVAWNQGRDLRTIVVLYKESLEYLRQAGFVHGYAVTLDRLGAVVQAQGDYESARKYYVECLTYNLAKGHGLGLAWTLPLLADLELVEGRAELSAKLLGAVDDYRASFRARSPFGDLAHYESMIAAVRVQLGEGAFTAAWTEGHVMTVEQAAAYALIGIRDLSPKA